MTEPATARRPKGRPRKPIEHGTNRGYQQHSYRRRRAIAAGQEPPPYCGDCRTAHSAAELARYHRTKPNPDRPVARCGTMAGANKHYRRKEKPCAGCRAAKNHYQNTRNQARRAAEQKGTRQ